MVFVWVGEGVGDMVLEMKFWFFTFMALTPTLSLRERGHIGGFL